MMCPKLGRPNCELRRERKKETRSAFTACSCCAVGVEQHLSFSRAHKLSLQGSGRRGSMGQWGCPDVGSGGVGLELVLAIHPSPAPSPFAVWPTRARGGVPLRPIKFAAFRSAGFRVATTLTTRTHISPPAARFQCRRIRSRPTSLSSSTAPLTPSKFT
jgi:hypothetical protein